MSAVLAKTADVLAPADDADDAAPPADGVVGAGAGAPASPLLVP
jgi:hypothetical protein